MDSRGVCWEDGKGEEYLEVFCPSISSAQCGVHLPYHSTGKLVDSPLYLPPTTSLGVLSSAFL